MTNDVSTFDPKPALQHWAAAACRRPNYTRQQSHQTDDEKDEYFSDGEVSVASLDTNDFEDLFED
jgi:hypothetical protein